MANFKSNLTWKPFHWFLFFMTRPNVWTFPQEKKTLSQSGWTNLLRSKFSKGWAAVWGQTALQQHPQQQHPQCYCCFWLPGLDWKLFSLSITLEVPTATTCCCFLFSASVIHILGSWDIFLDACSYHIYIFCRSVLPIDQMIISYICWATVIKVNIVYH